LLVALDQGLLNFLVVGIGRKGAEQH